MHLNVFTSWQTAQCTNVFAAFSLSLMVEFTLKPCIEVWGPEATFRRSLPIISTYQSSLLFRGLAQCLMRSCPKALISLSSQQRICCCPLNSSSVIPKIISARTFPQKQNFRVMKGAPTLVVYCAYNRSNYKRSPPDLLQVENLRASGFWF